MKKNKTQEALKECRLYVEGMHCSSCEILIEKKFLKYEQVEAVDASLNKSEVNIVLKNAQNLDISSINKDFEKIGYKFSNKKFIKKKETPAISFSNGLLKINSQKLIKNIKYSLLLIVLIISFLMLERSGLAAKVAPTSLSNPPIYFVFGLLAGASSCAALVGGVLLSMSKQWNEVYIADKASQKILPHMLFHVGRISSFFLIGGLLALIGSALKDFLQNASIFIALFVALVMFIMGAQMLDWNWANKISLTLPKSASRFAANENNFKGKYMPFLTGFFSFLIPCGLTLTAFTTVLESKDFISGALNMFAFSMGTFIFLGAISLTAVGFTSKPLMTANFNKVAGALIIFFAAFTLNSQIATINAKYEKDFITAQVLVNFLKPPSKGSTEVNEEGTQVIRMKVDSYKFEPETFIVEKGKPVEWIIDGTNASGCTGRLIGKGIFTGMLDVAGKTKTIKFTPTRRTTLNFSCWMGMVNGKIEVI